MAFGGGNVKKKQGPTSLKRQTLDRPRARRVEDATEKSHQQPRPLDGIVIKPSFLRLLAFHKQYACLCYKFEKEKGREKKKEETQMGGTKIKFRTTDLTQRKKVKKKW